MAKKREPYIGSHINSKTNYNKIFQDSQDGLKVVQIVDAKKKYLVAIPTEGQPARISLWESRGDKEIARLLVNAYELFKHLKSVDWMEDDKFKVLCQTVVTEM